MQEPSSSEYEKRCSIANQIAEQRKQDKILGIIIVGSVARRECYKSSDIDLIVVSDYPNKYQDEWVNGVPATTLTITPTDILNADEISRSELIQAEVLHDPTGIITKLIKEITDPEKSPKALKTSWLDKTSTLFREYAQQTEDNYSSLVWYRIAEYYAASSILLREHDIWKPRPKDIELLPDPDYFMKLMNCEQVHEKADLIQELFEIFENQLIQFLEQERPRISKRNHDMSINCATCHKSRLNAYYTQNGDWLSGVFGYRNYINQLYSYSIAEAYGLTPPHCLGSLLRITEPSTYPILSIEVNCFRKDINRQWSEIKKD